MNTKSSTINDLIKDVNIILNSPKGPPQVKDIESALTAQAQYLDYKLVQTMALEKVSEINKDQANKKNCSLPGMSRASSKNPELFS